MCSHGHERSTESVERGARDEEFDADGADVDLAATVVVSTRGGTRFHRSDEPLFVTACRTEFDSVERLPVSAALREGFSPCEKTACFGTARR